MGVFIGYFGTDSVPEEKRAELAERVLTVVRQGGMMERNWVEMFGLSLPLIGPPQPKKDGSFSYHYNYFSDELWEDAGYNAAEGRLWSNKVSTRLFGDIEQAVYILCEFYSETFCIAHWDGPIQDGRRYIGWFNYLFDEAYTNKRMLKPWKTFEAMNRVEDEGWDWGCGYGWNESGLLDIMDPEIAPGSPELWSCLMVSEPKVAEEMLNILDWARKKDAGGNQPETPMNLYLSLREQVQKIKESEGSDAEKLEILKQILCAEPEKKAGAAPDGLFKPAAFTSSSLPPAITAKVIADAFDLNFWKFYHEIQPAVKWDRSLWAQYEGAQQPLEPVEKISTRTYLKSGGVTDDDRAFFWKPDGDVQLSEEMWDWLRELSAELDGIEAGEGELIEGRLFLRTLMETLQKAQETYLWVYGFERMFYDFLEHAGSRRTKAAVILLDRLIERYRGDIPANAEYIGQVRSCPGRVKIKRYLAVLGNLELRERALGF